MAKATVNSKGQITIPKAIREWSGLRPGDRIDFIPQASGRVLMVPRTRKLEHLFRVLPKPKRRLRLDEIDAAVAAAVAGRVMGKRR